MPADVSKTSVVYDRMAERWKLIEALLGGTRAMRKAGRTWLPQFEDESKANYDARVAQTVLYEMLKDTLKHLAAKPFSRNVNVNGLPGKLEFFHEDVDREGTTLSVFLKNAFRTAASYGLVHCLVDKPPLLEEGSTQLDDERLNRRAYFRLIDPRDLIAWRVTRDMGGRRRLAEIRLREKDLRPVDLYEDEEADLVRVIRPNDWEVHRRATDRDKRMGVKEGWILEERGTFRFPRNEIPIRTLYFDRVGFMEATPPLEPLAWINLIHYQSLSDQRNILHYARLITLFVKGLTESEKKRKIVLGTNNAVTSTSPQADAKFLEIGGPSMEAGQADLTTLERRAEVLGLQPELRRQGTTTATERSIDEAAASTDLQAWVRATEMWTDSLFELASIWDGVDLPEEFATDIFNEFGLTSRARQDLDTLYKTWIQNGISDETYLREIQRRGVLSSAIEIEDELAAKEEQADRNFERMARSMTGDSDESGESTGAAGDSEAA